MCFPGPWLTQMIAVGRTDGAMDRHAKKIAECLRGRSESGRAVKDFVGCDVNSVIVRPWPCSRRHRISMYLPIFS